MAAAVIIIPSGQWAYALTYGFGHILLDATRIDQGFGLLFATRTLSPDQIRVVTRHAMDRQARTERSTIPAGDSMTAFGVEEYGEIVSRLAGRVTCSR